MCSALCLFTLPTDDSLDLQFENKCVQRGQVAMASRDKQSDTNGYNSSNSNSNTIFLAHVTQVGIRYQNQNQNQSASQPSLTLEGAHADVEDMKRLLISSYYPSSVYYPAAEGSPRLVL